MDAGKRESHACMHVILGDIAAGKARAWQGIEAWMMGL
jgi:hypothetical protein